jgi:serine/threonine protein phosphatase PrpC
MLKKEDDPSGSTGVIVYYDGRKKLLTVAGVGDTLCILSRNGRAIVMNRMHRLDILEEKERIRNNGGTVIASRYVVRSVAVVFHVYFGK